MPELKPEVLNAFRLLDINTNATQAEITKAYKTEALRQHPDKNPGDPAATQRFQKLGAAYDICLRHFEDPQESYIPERGSYAGDGEIYIDPEDLAFFMFMFEEAIFGRYSRSSRRDYRSRRGGQRGPSFVFDLPFMGGGGYYSSGGYSSSTYASSGSGLPRPHMKNVYGNSVCTVSATFLWLTTELEMEIAAEKRELQRQAMEKSKDESRRAAAYQQAFQAARAGNASTVIKLVGEYDLDVNSPEKMSRQATAKKTDKPINFQTLLHAACRTSDEGLILFLLDKGAMTEALNDAKLYPFHVAISCGNVVAVKFFLLRRVNGKFTPGCHPSKVAPDGRTPLNIAITSGNAEMIALMTKEATVHDVERCWQQTDDPEVKTILSAKKGFVDPETKESLRLEADRKLAEDRAREEQRVADERARQEEKARIKEERAKKLAEKRAAEEFARKRREAEAAARRQAELEAQEKMAAEARRRAELEARAQAEAEAVRQAAEARVRAEAQARQLAEQQERGRRQAEEETRRRKAAEAEAKRIQREAEAAAVRQEVEAEARRQAAVHAEALRIAAAENARLLEVAAQEAERNRRVALEQQKLEAKRAETLRRLQGQAEEHRRQANARLQVEKAPKVPAEHTAHPLHDHLQAKAKIQAQEPDRSPEVQKEEAARLFSEQQRRKLPKKHVVRDLSQLSAEELAKRAAQSARDKARIAEEKRRKMQELNAKPGTPESIPSNGPHVEDYIPPTPVSMPSPSQRRPSLNPPLVPRHTRPNVPAKTIDDFGTIMLGPEDIQTGAIPDDLFAVERPVAAAFRESAPTFRGYGRGRGYRGRARGSFEWRGRGRGRGGFQRAQED
ncbi:hypothetical protein B0H11DRAFT_2011493 [Mycena galericulata]|nr:hypothetical protein B0H11DRAFT_2011493 [Mycena galericulata]